MKSLKILIADDDVSFRTLLRRYLEKAGHGVCLAKDGDEAINGLTTGINVLITDMDMPKYNGREVLTVAKHGFPHIRRIAMSEKFHDITLQNLKELEVEMIFEKEHLKKALQDADLIPL